MVTKRWGIRILCSLLAVATAITWVAESMGQEGYDLYGYNYLERTFNGLYENADRDLTNNTGDQTWLRMEWNDLFNLIQPEFSGSGAWVTNFQTGTYIGQDGKTYRWSYSVKIEYTGPGSPLWGYFTISKDRESYLGVSASPTPLYKPPLLPLPGP